MNIIDSTNNFANDVSIKTISKGQVSDEDVLKQSIENILGTCLGERLFNLSFGCPLMIRIFEIGDAKAGNQLIDDIVRAIKYWDNRVTLIESDIRLNIDLNNHSAFISIPFIINATGLKSVFQKKIIM